MNHLRQQQTNLPDIYMRLDKNRSSSNSSANIPAWMVTFADLMALMMTFFVLLYSFSKVDEGKYKSIVDSLSEGFDGVQWIKRRFMDDDSIGPEPGILAPPIVTESTEISKLQQLDQTQLESSQVTKQKKQRERLFEQLNQNFKKEIETGLIFIEQKSDKTVIRFPDNVSFTSGSNQLVQNFVPIIHRVSDILKNSKGNILVAGHTDDQAISSKRFRSNWELSTSRAVSVAHYLLESNQIERSKIMVAGHADTQPLVKNDTSEHRAKNRRVEISIFNDEGL